MTATTGRRPTGYRRLANDTTSPNMGSVALPKLNRGGHPRRTRFALADSASLLDGVEGSSISTRDLPPGDLCNAIRAVIRIVKE
jgi:hypothetical protein